jgi:hypothetical protein
MVLSSLASSLAVLVAACSVVRAQPSLDVQRRISAAIQAAIVNGSRTIDYTTVNPFIGTGTSLSPTKWNLSLISYIRYSHTRQFGRCMVRVQFVTKLYLPANAPSL